MKHKILYLGLAVLTLGACTGPVIMGGDAAVMYISKPDAPPPADTASQIPQHESWCYSTMGDPECYAHPQDVPPSRLINVEPQNRYPVDLRAYHDAVIEGQGPAVRPAAVTSAPVVTPAPATTP